MKNPTKTSRFESLLNLIDLCVGNEMEGFDFEDLATFCQDEIDALARKAEKARERAEAKRAEPDVLRDLVAEVLSADVPQSRADVLSALNEAHPELTDVTLGKLTPRLSALVKEGIAVKEVIQVSDGEGPKKKVTVYSLATED